MLFYYSQSLIFLLSKNGLDILQLLQNRVSIQKSTRYFATCTKNRPDILLSKNRPDILLSKNRPDIFKVVPKSTRYFAAKNRVGFLVENRPIKSMHNFETNCAPYHGWLRFQCGSFKEHYQWELINLKCWASLC